MVNLVTFLDNQDHGNDEVFLQVINLTLQGVDFYFLVDSHALIAWPHQLRTYPFDLNEKSLHTNDQGLKRIAQTMKDGRNLVSSLVNV